MATHEFLVYGMGKGTGAGNVWKGAHCPEPEGCPKGIPSKKTDEDSTYAAKGYVPIQGPYTPSRLGGRRFDTEAKAMTWLNSKEGGKFKETFLNVFLVRVTA